MDKNFRKGIALLVPSRKRVKQLQRFWRSCWLKCNSLKNIKLYLYIDDDDEETLLWAEQEFLKSPYNIYYLVGPRIKMSDMVNKLYPIVMEGILFLAADDLVMRTYSWDKIIIDAFEVIPDRIAVMYGEDLNPTQHPVDFGTHPIVHDNWVKVLGYLSPPYFSCDYADTWINDLAKSVNRHYKLPFINEHMHHTNGKAEFDDTYKENREKFWKENIPKIYRDTAKERVISEEKLKQFIKTYEHTISTP